LRRYRSRCVAWVFQDLNLIAHLNVVENAALPLLCRGWKRRAALAVAKRYVEQLGLADWACHYPHQLSRGQKQRVAIARAFASDAQVILADEPTGSLDPATADSVLEAFRDLSEETGKPVVLVTHDQERARQYADRILLCKAGQLIEVWRRGKARKTMLASPAENG
jgi:putative ABC transport system ATP-binding protein